MNELFEDISYRTSRLVTNAYSTSFSIGVRSLHPSIRNAIYSIYGFVRLADEIVDTFHEYDKSKLLADFEHAYYEALKDRISLNPVLNSFQETVRKFNITDDLVQAFLNSMKCDLNQTKYDEKGIKDYIYGSADVVGLMCLKVFVNGNKTEYEKLKPYAMRLGSAFQKINFLRDLQHDTNDLHRIYFPILKSEPLNKENKKTILNDIMEDYRVAMIGIEKLPKEAMTGVYIAYLYYRALTKRIQLLSAEDLMSKRISVPTYEKILLLCRAYIYTKLN